MWYKLRDKLKENKEKLCWDFPYYPWKNEE